MNGSRYNICNYKIWGKKKTRATICNNSEKKTRGVEGKYRRSFPFSYCRCHSSVVSIISTARVTKKTSWRRKVKMETIAINYESKFAVVFRAPLYFSENIQRGARALIRHANSTM